MSGRQEHDLSCGLKATYEVVKGDYEGSDADPGFGHNVPAYVEDVTVLTPDGTDITEWINERGHEEISEELRGYL